MFLYGIFTKRKEVSKQKQSSKIDWPEHVITLDSEMINQFIEKYPLSAVDFRAPWCSPCKIMNPRMRRLSKIYQGKVAFGRLDTQQYKDSAQKYKIMSIPSLAFFSHGKKITSITGVKSVGEIKDIINSLLQK
jgi:thioredoxin 1